MPGLRSHTLLASCVLWAWYYGKHLEHLLCLSQGVSSAQASSTSTTVRYSLVNDRRKYTELEAWESSAPDSLEGRIEYKPVRVVTRHPRGVGCGVGGCRPAPVPCPEAQLCGAHGVSLYIHPTQYHRDRTAQPPGVRSGDSVQETLRQVSSKTGGNTH